MEKRRKRRIWIVVLSVIVVLCLGVGWFLGSASYQMSLIPGMTFREMLNYTTKGKTDAVITVGILQNGTLSYSVYGCDGAELPPVEHTYEIGSLTKTFTASLLCKAISEGKVELDATIDRYLDLPEQDYYPTLRRLVTHTSGYSPYYLNWQIASNFLSGQANDFYGVSVASLEEKIGKIALEDKDYPFQYSNFGFAAVGDVLAKGYETNYTELMNSYIQEELQLSKTRLSDGGGDLDGYWNWAPEDAYLPAGALTSTVGDMLQYLKLQMSGELPYLAQSHAPLARVEGDEKYARMGLHMDGVGIGWMLDEQNGIVWHNGGTSEFNSYAAFHPDSQSAVVILSNLSPNEGIPATIAGPKLMEELLGGNQAG